MVTFKEFITEADNLNKELKNILKGLKGTDADRFKIITLDRERTNYDSTWEKEYFYGDLKAKSKSDMKWYMEKWTELFPDKVAGKRITGEDLAKFYVGDLKKYFSGMNEATTKMKSAGGGDLVVAYSDGHFWFNGENLGSDIKSARTKLIKITNNSNFVSKYLSKEDIKNKKSTEKSIERHMRKLAKDEKPFDFMDLLKESKKNTYKVTNKEFNTKQFQNWIKKYMGDINDGDKNSESVYLNKSGEEVFMYDFSKNELTILQDKLTIQQLVMYGLNVSTIVKEI